MDNEKKFTQIDFKDSINLLKKVKLWGFKEYQTSRLLYRTVLNYMLCGVRYSSGLKKLVGRALFKNKYYINDGGLKNATVIYRSRTYERRKDMLEIYDRLKFVSKYISVIKEHQCKQSINKDFVIRILCAIQWYFVLRGNGFSMDLVMLFISDLLNIYEMKKYLKTNKKKILEANAFIVLNDEYCDENLFVQFGNNCKIPTATLQHGLYIKTLPDNDINHFMHVFPNITANQLFMWGDYHKAIAVYCGVDETKIVSVGIPKYIDIQIQQKNQKNRIIGLFLDGYSGINYQSNIKMINICNRYCKEKGYKYLVKLHPTDKKSNYIDFFDKKYYIGVASNDEKIIDFIAKIEFGVVSKSSVFIELIYLGVDVFRFYDLTDRDYYDGIIDFRFSTYKQFINCIEEMICFPEQHTMRFIKLRDYCCCSGNIGDNYRDAIKRLAAHNL